MNKLEEIWEYEICDIKSDVGSSDANTLLEGGWEPFSASETEKEIHLWLRRKISIEEKED